AGRAKLSTRSRNNSRVRWIEDCQSRVRASSRSGSVTFTGSLMRGLRRSSADVCTGKYPAPPARGRITNKASPASPEVGAQTRLLFWLPSIRDPAGVLQGLKAPSRFPRLQNGPTTAHTLPALSTALHTRVFRSVCQATRLVLLAAPARAEVVAADLRPCA